MFGKAALTQDKPAVRRPKCSMTFAVGRVGDRLGRALIRRDVDSPSPSPLGGQGHKSISRFHDVRMASRPSCLGRGLKSGSRRYTSPQG